jgi:DUF971 family protein
MTLPQSAFVPVEVRAPRGGDTVEIDWADGHTSRLPNELLRGYCPCAGCQGHSGSIRYIAAQNAVIETIDEVGNYGLTFGWADGHNSGIYDYRYLRGLCACTSCYPGSPQSRKETLPRG